MDLGFNLYGGGQSGGQLERSPVSQVNTDQSLPSAIAGAFQIAEQFPNFTATLERDGPDSSVIAVSILAWHQPGKVTEITARVV